MPIAQTTYRVLFEGLDPQQAVAELMGLAEKTQPAAVSMTGGEPLEQPDFVAAVSRAVRRNGLKVYLETSGLEVDGLVKVRPFVDVVAMDIKLPSATGQEPWDVHREFLKWLVGRNAFVKVVVDSPTPLEEIKAAVHLVAEVDRRFPFVLQPESMTYLKEKSGREARDKLSRVLDQGQRIALESLNDVRVIPQCHKIMRVR